MKLACTRYMYISYAAKLANGRIDELRTEPEDLLAISSMTRFLSPAYLH